MTTTVTLEPDTWILVADGEKALFLKNIGDDDYPHFDVVRKDQIDNPPRRDQAANRPGRFNDGPSVHRSAVADTDWHELGKERFADELAERLFKMAHNQRYERLVVAAAPSVLGNLRPKLHQEVTDKLVAEIDKDFTNHPIEEIEELVTKSLREH